MIQIIFTGKTALKRNLERKCGLIISSSFESKMLKMENCIKYSIELEVDDTISQFPIIN